MLFGIGEEEVTTESNNTIPWLIWTQLFVLLLLFLLLFFFTVVPLDPDDDHHHNNVFTAAAATPPLTTSSNVFFFDDIQQIDSPLTIHDSSTTTRQHVPTLLQGRKNLLIKGEIATGSSMGREEEIMEEEEEEEEEANPSLYFHPCHYFQLATVAFLKCFGLDSESETPSTRRHSRKRKES